MVAPIGNQFWKKRSSHGPKPKFRSAQALWAACCEYFEWVDTNPLEHVKVYSVGGKLEYAGVAKIRAMSLHGLCIFLDISHATWHRYRKRRGFLDVMNQAEAVIRTQKFEGAAAFMLHAGVILTDMKFGERTADAADAQASQEQVKIDADEVTRKLLHGTARRSEEGEA